MIICLEYEGEREMPVSFCRLGLFRRIYRLRTSCVALPEHWCCPSHCHCKHRLKALTAPVIGKKSSHRHHFSCHILDRNGGHSSTWDVEVCARPHRQTVPLSPSRGNMSSKPMMAMPTIQGEAVELFPRKPPTPINTGRPMSRESLPEDNEALLSTILTRRPSTSASENRAPVVSPGQARAGDVQQESKSRANDVGGGRPPLAGGPRCVGGDLDGDGDKRGSSAPEVSFACCSTIAHVSSFERHKRACCLLVYTRYTCIYSGVYSSGTAVDYEFILA